jgi:hypothetical protein
MRAAKKEEHSFVISSVQSQGCALMPRRGGSAPTLLSVSARARLTNTHNKTMSGKTRDSSGVAQQLLLLQQQQER